MKHKNTMGAGIDNKTRKAVYRRDGYRCALCDSTDGLQIHHVKPRGKGGADHPMNLITLCWRCHAAAHGSIVNDAYATMIQQSMMMNERTKNEMTYLFIYSVLRKLYQEGKIAKRTFEVLNTKNAERQGCKPVVI